MSGRVSCAIYGVSLVRSQGYMYVLRIGGIYIFHIVDPRAVVVFLICVLYFDAVKNSTNHTHS